MLDIEVKSFFELTTRELYHLLQLRSDVFVIEQHCLYRDIDGKDERARHVLGTSNGTIVAYARIFEPGDYFEAASIGRVVVANKKRALKYGYRIVKASIEAIEELYQTKKIKISAQIHLKAFYNTLGFETYGLPYLEDEIPHIAMIRNGRL